MLLDWKTSSNKGYKGIIRLWQQSLTVTASQELMTGLFNENIRIEYFENGVNSKSNKNVCLDKKIQTRNMYNLLKFWTWRGRFRSFIWIIWFHILDFWDKKRENVTYWNSQIKGQDCMQDMYGDISAHKDEMSSKWNDHAFELISLPGLRERSLTKVNLSSKYLKDVPIMAALRGRQTAAVNVFTLNILPDMATYKNGFSLFAQKNQKIFEIIDFCSIFQSFGFLKFWCTRARLFASFINRVQFLLI